MPTLSKIMGAGEAALTAKTKLGVDAPNVAVSAAGTTQGTATLLTTDFNKVTTAALNSGVILPATNLNQGDQYIVANHGANALAVYPPTGHSLGTLAANAAATVAVGKFATFIYAGSSNWLTSV